MGISSSASASILPPLVIGVVILALFGLHETYDTTIGIFHHDQFVGPQTSCRIVVFCIFITGVEGILVFSYILIYPAL